MRDLRQNLLEADQANGLHLAAKVRHEPNAITEHPASAIGLGDRDRNTSSSAERARSAVTKRIKRAIQKTSESIPHLGHYLDANIKTGCFCSYQPHSPAAWTF